MRALLILGALAGCTAVFGLSEAPNSDLDDDRVDDARDNCPELANPDQSDRDNDGIGDACDACEATRPDDDIDGDGLPDECDGCDNRQPDDNEDGVPDACQLTCAVAQQQGVDRDRDGLDDGCDPCVVGRDPDDDGDGTANACDVCPGGDEHDEDGDGIPDACDNCPLVVNPGQENTSGTSNEPSPGSLPDMAGDACTSPGGPAAQLVFDGFARDNAGWYQRGVGWSRDPATHSYVLSGKATSMRALGSVKGSWEIRAVVQFVTLDPIFEGSVHVLASQEPTMERDAAVACIVDSMGVRISGPAGMSQPLLWSGTLSTAQPFQIVQRMVDGSLSCEVIQGGISLATVAMLGVGAFEGTGGIGGDRANVRFHAYQVLTW